MEERVRRDKKEKWQQRKGGSIFFSDFFMVISDFFMKSTNHNVVYVFGFPAEAGIEKNFVLSLCKMLNLIDVGMKTQDPLDVCQILAEVTWRPLDIPGSETGGLAHSVRVRAVPSGIWVTFVFFPVKG